VGKDLVFSCNHIYFPLAVSYSHRLFITFANESIDKKEQTSADFKRVVLQMNVYKIKNICFKTA